MLNSLCALAWPGACGVAWRVGLREAVCICRRAIELKLNDYLVVGPSILSHKAGMTDSMIAELFESVSLLCAAPIYTQDLHCHDNAYILPPVSFKERLRTRSPHAAQVLGAVYVDGGLDRAREMYTTLFPLPDSIRKIIKPPIGLQC